MNHLTAPGTINPKQKFSVKIENPIKIAIIKKVVLDYEKIKKFEELVTKSSKPDYEKIKSFEELTTKSRKRKLVLARQLTMYMLKEYTKLSLKTIGEMFGGRDHTTVIHSKNAILDLRDTDEEIRAAVFMIRAGISQKFSELEQSNNLYESDTSRH